MAILEVSPSKSAGKLLNYVNKKAVLSSGTVASQFSINQFELIRNIHDKNTGRQAHHIIQSHRAKDNVTPEEALAIADELAQDIAKGHDYVIAIHDDKEHMHAHIVINSVHADTGMKFQQSKQDLYDWRDKSDEICLKYEIQPVKEDEVAAKRYSYKERQLIKRTGTSHNEVVRLALDEILEDVYDFKIRSFEDFSDVLNEYYQINPRIRTRERDGHQTITYDDELSGRKVRASRLGNDYTLDSVLDRIELMNAPAKRKSRKNDFEFGL